MKLFQNKISSIFLFTVLLLLTGCNRPKGVISQSEMESVLTDLHKLDGAMAAKGIAYAQWDQKNEYYVSVLKKHGINQAIFDSSVVYYNRDPKKFERIYDNVIKNLTDLQTDVNKGKYHDIDSSEIHKIKYNIWNGRTKYVLTKDSARSRVKFEINDQGFMLDDMYTLRFLQRISPKDSSTNKLIRFQINYEDGYTHGIIKKVKADHVTRRYTLRIWSTHPYKVKSISGELLGSTVYKGKQDAMIDSITLMRMYDSRKQDSLRKVLELSDPKHYPPMFRAPIVPEPVKTQRNIRMLVLKK